MSNYVQLREITSKIGAGATPTGGKNAYHSQGISFIRSQNVHDFKFSLDGLAFIDEKQAKELNNVTVEENDILLNITGDSIARVCVVPNKILPARVNQHVAIIRCISNVDCHYVFYYLENLKPYLLKICGVGGTRNALTKEAIEKLEIHLPEISTQQKIASVLSALDSKIELNNRINAELEAMAKTLYDYWFVQFDFPDKNGKPYKSNGGKMVWNEELKREIPEGWEVNEIEAFAQFVNGKGIKKEDVNDSGNYAVYGSNGITGFTNKILFKEPVIAIGRVGANYGEVHYSIAPCWISDNAVTAQPYKTFYLWWLIDTLKRINYLKIAGGSAQPLITQGQLKKLKFAVPKDTLFKDFDEIVNPIYMQLNLNIKQNQKLTELRDWLLPMLMNGQVKVSEL